MGLVLLLWGCGKDNGDDPLKTPYGALADVKAYRQNIEIIIVQVSTIEALAEEQAVGSANIATAANLYTVYIEQRPQLIQIIEQIDAIKPPPALSDLHQNIRYLVILRLEAYSAVINGWTTQDETLYDVAEEKLRQANILILSLNEQLVAIDETIEKTENNNPLAA